jgi:hypothetical protein
MNYQYQVNIEKKQEFIDWVFEIKNKLPHFLNSMKGKNNKGFYRYSYSGDILGEKFRWGLGNSVFALKIYYSICQNPDNLSDIEKYIQKFQHKNGEYFDPFVRWISLPFRAYFAIKELDYNRFDHKFTRRGETRQAISALKLFNFKPKYIFNDFPQTQTNIQDYIENLNWKSPWGAGAHFSALMFFLSVTDLPGKNELIEFTINTIKKYQRDDGCWYTGKPSIQQKINGAMKVISGLKAAASMAGYNNGKVEFNKVNALIDTALLASNEEHACDNFNLVYVLRYANELAKSNYKYNEIEDFMQKRLDIYKQFYFQEFGAFSFYKNKANSNYYGAIISKGRNEPDIHGTVMFIWGLSVIASFWNINNLIGLQEFVT